MFLKFEQRLVKMHVTKSITRCHEKKCSILSTEESIIEFTEERVTLIKEKDKIILAKISFRIFLSTCICVLNQFFFLREVNWSVTVQNSLESWIRHGWHVPFNDAHV